MIKNEYNNPKRKQDPKAKSEKNVDDMQKIISKEKKEENRRHINSYYGGSNPYD